MDNIQYIIFYDASCGLCSNAVSFVIKQDKNKIFYFAPIGGKTWEQEIGDAIPMSIALDSVVLLDKTHDPKQIFIRSKAAFRVLWLLGGIFACMGVFSFLPKFLLYPSDLVYRFIAKHRHAFCPVVTPEKFDRLLP